MAFSRSGIICSLTLGSALWMQQQWKVGCDWAALWKTPISLLWLSLKRNSINHFLETNYCILMGYSKSHCIPTGLRRSLRARILNLWSANQCWSTAPWWLGCAGTRPRTRGRSPAVLSSGLGANCTHVAQMVHGKFFHIVPGHGPQKIEDPCLKGSLTGTLDYLKKTRHAFWKPLKLQS